MLAESFTTVEAHRAARDSIVVPITTAGFQQVTAIMQRQMAAQQPILGLLLAAGSGTRFGGGKLLHPLDDGVCIAVHAARNLLAADMGVLAIVRAGDFALAELLELEGCN